MEEQIREILSTASFADAEARVECERKLCSLMAGMKALESAYAQQQQVWSDGIVRADAAEAMIAWIETFDPRIVDDARAAFAKEKDQ